AAAAPPPPATPRMIAVFAPVESSPPPPPVAGAAGPGVLGVPVATGPRAPGIDVWAFSPEATVRHPPWGRGVTPGTVRTLVAGVTAGFAVDAVPRTCTRLPRFEPKS